MNRWNASWDLFWNDLDFSKLLEFEGHCSRRRLVAYGNPRELTPGDYHVKMPSPGSVLVQGRAANLAVWRPSPHRISLRLAARLLRLPLKGGVIPALETENILYTLDREHG